MVDLGPLSKHPSDDTLLRVMRWLRDHKRPGYDVRWTANPLGVRIEYYRGKRTAAGFTLWSWLESKATSPELVLQWLCDEIHDKIMEPEAKS